MLVLSPKYRFWIIWHLPYQQLLLFIFFFCCGFVWRLLLPVLLLHCRVKLVFPLHTSPPFSYHIAPFIFFLGNAVRSGIGRNYRLPRQVSNLLHPPSCSCALSFLSPLTTCPFKRSAPLTQFCCHFNIKIWWVRKFDVQRPVRSLHFVFRKGLVFTSIHPGIS